MIQINTNEKKRLKFNIRVSGVDPKDLRGSMKIMHEGVQYGFPISIMDGDVTVDIKPLATVIAQEFKDGDVLDSILEVVAGDTYIIPWQDKIRVSNPLKIEATLSEEEIKTETVTPSISIKSIIEEKLAEDDDAGDKKDCPDGYYYCPVRKQCVKNAVAEKKKPSTKFSKFLS